MPAVLSRRVRAVAGVAVLAATTALSAAAPLGLPGTSAPRPAAASDSSSGPFTAVPQLDAAVTPQGRAAPVAAPVAGAVPTPPAAGGVTQASVPMSLDEPIQGGLTARQAQRASAKIRAGHDTPSTAKRSEQWTAAMGKTAVARARSWLGLPYSWAGGGVSGPSAGRCEPGSGAGLDCRIVGFDCSGLMMYAWGAYLGLPHLASSQQAAGRFRPSVKQLRAGDLVFFSGYIPGGVGHVAIYEGDGNVIEAPQSGGVVQRSPLARLLANDGTYRGAVRPMTADTPALTGITTVAHKGGKVTMRGTGLAGVESVTVDGKTIDKLRRSADAITVKVPRASQSAQHTVAVTVRTLWGATSAPIALTYLAEPKRVTSKPAPTTSDPAPTTPSPGKPKPTKPKPTEPKPSKPKPTEPKPSPTKPAPTEPSDEPTSSGSTAPAAPETSPDA